MELTIVKDKGCRRLLLLMAGWGMDPAPFRELYAPGYDVAVAWNYETEKFDSTILERYREIVVVAWSMGVMEADRILPKYSLPITLTVAVNGTLTPVNDGEGIPVKVFEGTLATLSEENVTRFNRRMCGGGELFRLWNDNAPARTIESLKRELALLGERAMETAEHEGLYWDMAIVGSRDMIFPAESQLRAWRRYNAVVKEIDAPHLPPFEDIIHRVVVNKEKVAVKFGSSRQAYSWHASTQLRVAQNMASRLKEILPKRHWERVIEIGSGNKEFTSLYAPQLDYGTLELWDIASVGDEPRLAGESVVIDDAEARLNELKSDSVDMVLSSSSIQWFNSPVAALRNIRRILRSGGVGAVSVYVDGTFETLSRVTGRSINYFTPASLREAIGDNCQVLVDEVADYMEEFESTRELIEHTRLTGVNALGGVSHAIIRNMLRSNEVHSLEYKSELLIFIKK